MTLTFSHWSYGGIAEGYIVDFHILALPENQQSGTESFANTVIAQLVFHKAFVYEVGAIVAQFSPLSLNNTTAIIDSDKSDVLDAFGEDETVVVGGVEAVVVEWVGAAHQHGALDATR